MRHPCRERDVWPAIRLGSHPSSLSESLAEVVRTAGRTIELQPRTSRCPQTPASRLRMYAEVSYTRDFGADLVALDYGC